MFDKCVNCAALASKFYLRRLMNNNMRPSYLFVPRRNFYIKRTDVHPGRTLKRDLYKRRKAQGPEPDRPRSAFVNWNYDAEIFAFGKRFGEEFREETIKTAFIDRSYVEQELEQRKALEVETDVLPLDDNRKLVQKGEEVMSTFIKAFFRKQYPRLPEECVCSINDHFASEAVLFNVASNFGIKDLILCSHYPPSSDVMCNTLKAVIGAVAEDEGTAKAERFVQDFIITQLIGTDINEYLGITNPMGLLAGILKEEGRGEPEARLIFESGSQTVLSVYMVGIYVDKQLIGKAFGETVLTAEEMAARDALRNYFGTTLEQPPLSFDQNNDVESYKEKPNISVAHYFNASNLQIDQAL